MSGTFRNPVVAGAPGADHGDPFIIKYLDAFYLYHTGDTAGRRGVSVHRSHDLVHWEFVGYALEAAEAGWAWSDLWAPEVVYERGVFYMYISATRGGEDGRRLGLARATSPTGPFQWDDEPLLDRWSIDGHPFRDDDGTMWLFYNVRTEDEPRYDGLLGTGTLCDRLAGSDRLEGSPHAVTFPSQRWEGNAAGDWYWNEGPYVLKRRGRYFQMYSGGYFDDESYGVGCAVASEVPGPWVKREDNPLLHSRGSILGPGHHSFVFGPDGATAYAVYHGYVRGDSGRKVHLDRLVWAGDVPRITGPTDGDQPLPPPALLDDAVPHWRGEAWVRGSWVEVARERLALEPADVWHQVEAIEFAGRISTRVGGVLRSSRPVGDAARRGAFASDGDVRFVTLSSTLEDGALHELPAGSSYAWRWGGSGTLELDIAVDGSIELAVGDEVVRHDAERGRYSVIHLVHGGGADEIAVYAGADGAVVTDLSVHARPAEILRNVASA